MKFQDRIQKPALPKYYNALIYGEPGSGKTHFCTTAPKPILFIDVGNEGVGQTVYGMDDIDIIPVDTSKELDDVLSEINTQKNDYQTLVIDPWHSVEEIVTTEVMRKLDSDKLRPQDWPMVTSLLKKIITDRLFSFHDKNVILTAHAEPPFQERPTDPIKPRMKRAVYSYVGGKAPAIGFFQAYTVNKVDPKTRSSEDVFAYEAHFGPAKTHISRVRRPNILPKLSASEFLLFDPTWDKMVALLSSTGKQTKQKKQKLQSF